MTGLKRGSAAVVGVAESDLGHVAEGLNVIDLMAQGIARAAEDAGLRVRDIDGLICATTQARTAPSCPRAPTRWPLRDTCTNLARPASRWPRSRSRRGNGRC